MGYMGSRGGFPESGCNGIAGKQGSFVKTRTLWRRNRKVRSIHKATTLICWRKLKAESNPHPHPHPNNCDTQRFPVARETFCRLVAEANAGGGRSVWRQQTPGYWLPPAQPRNPSTNSILGRAMVTKKTSEPIWVGILGKDTSRKYSRTKQVNIASGVLRERKDSMCYLK